MFSRQELIEKFSLERVQRSGARFDEQRLLWMNGQWIRRLSLDDLYDRITHYWPESAAAADETYKRQILSLVQDRLKTLADLPVLSDYFFTEPSPDSTLIDSNKQLRKLSSAEQRELLTAIRTTLTELDETQWSGAKLQATLNQLLETTGQKPGVLFSLLRIVTTWAPFSPQLNDTLALLGRHTTLQRLDRSIDFISNK